MKALFGTLMLLTTLTSLQAMPLPQEAPKPQPPAESRESQKSQEGQAVQAAQQPAPPPKDQAPAPRDQPPPPPAELPKPPADPPRAERSQASPGGQWVHTEQYGWVWMPYGDRYTHAPPDGSTPSMYVYGPEVGWGWVVAPWLWGYGPSPYFGLLGPRYYGWFGVGLGHWYGFRPHDGYRGWYGYRGWVGPHYGRGFRHGGAWSGAWSGPMRGRGGVRGFGGGGVRR